MGVRATIVTGGTIPALFGEKDPRTITRRVRGGVTGQAKRYGDSHRYGMQRRAHNRGLCTGCGASDQGPAYRQYVQQYAAVYTAM